VLIESGAVRPRHAFKRIGSVFVLALALLFLIGDAASAQLVQITPNTSITPSKTIQPWIYQMALGAAILGLLVILAVSFGYLRFAPKFFGREEATKLPPGARPSTLVRQAAAIRYTPPPASAPHAAPVPAPAARATATAVAERAAPAPAEAPAERAAAPPEARPSAKAAEEVGAEPEAPAPPPAEAAAPAPTPAPAATPAPAPSAPTPAAGHGPSAALDQETFDRVLKEQLDRGVDRRVAEGRARAAAVVAARKKAQG